MLLNVFTHQAAENELSIRQRKDISIFPKNKTSEPKVIRVNVHVAQHNKTDLKPLNETKWKQIVNKHITFVSQENCHKSHSSR